jgi:hypothetical protein
MYSVIFVSQSFHNMIKIIKQNVYMHKSIDNKYF